LDYSRLVAFKLLDLPLVTLDVLGHYRRALVSILLDVGPDRLTLAMARSAASMLLMGEESAAAVFGIVGCMPWERRWVDTRGLPPWRPEAQRAGPADGYWIDVFVESTDERKQREMLEAERGAALDELLACRDASAVIETISLPRAAATEPRGDVVRPI
jgi:hypothetical protein